MKLKRRPPNKPTDVFRFIVMSRVKGDCWGWIGGVVGRDSRPYFSIDGKKYLAYRIVYELTSGKTLQRGEMIRHTCDNKMCCNPEHFEIGSHQQNMDDMKERQRHGLPHHTVRHILRLILKDVPDNVIADRYGVSVSLVQKIRRREIYAHVKLEDGRMIDPIHRGLNDVERMEDRDTGEGG